ncbi:MAG: hypothetical protein HYV47_00715 [Candidatus Nealsonbacteria bacterium]|nr:hypothetical protein [Candidatus Nealsonbacteria bacterium]
MTMVVIAVKKIIFDMHLAIIWKVFDGIKFEIEKNILQLRAYFMSGENQLKKELLLFYGKDRPYQSFAGRGFEDVPFLRNSDDRFKIIKENLTARKGTLLDIGANLGYFCHKFEDEGFDCCALEENRMLSYFIEKLKKAANKSFKVIPQSIFNYKKNEKLVFDVVLALSVFHHFLKSKEAYFNLIIFLKRLEAKELFFEPHLPREFGGKIFYKNYTPEQFVDFIIQNSCFKKVEFVGKSEGGRPIFKFSEK